MMLQPIIIIIIIGVDRREVCDDARGTGDGGRGVQFGGIADRRRRVFVNVFG